MRTYVSESASMQLYRWNLYTTLESFCLDDFFVSGKYLRLKYKHNLCKYWSELCELHSPPIALDHMSVFFDLSFLMKKKEAI